MSADAELLAACAHLRTLVAEWQRLYALTSDKDECVTSADLEWQAFHRWTWPGTRAVAGPKEQDPLRHMVFGLPAATAEGRQAKAAIVLAADQASNYGDCREDAYEMMEVVIREAAGVIAIPIGKDAASRSLARMRCSAARRWNESRHRSFGQQCERTVTVSTEDEDDEKRSWWDYRLFRHEEGSEVTYQIHEAFYEDGCVTTWTKEPVVADAETRKGILDTLGAMATAYERPVLHPETGQELEPALEIPTELRDAIKLLLRIGKAPSDDVR